MLRHIRDSMKAASRAEYALFEPGEALTAATPLPSENEGLQPWTAQGEVPGNPALPREKSA
jgi:hypothetical protein